MENNQTQNMNTEQAEQNNGNTKPIHVEPKDKKEASNTLALSTRPVNASDLQVVETMNIMGIRPITANTFQVVDTINLSGVRPIASSDLVISQTYSIMGNRPVAPNEIDDSETLMGFLD
jgi:hypothetical protein